jgi:hypothetical protein
MEEKLLPDDLNSVLLESKNIQTARPAVIELPNVEQSTFNRPIYNDRPIINDKPIINDNRPPSMMRNFNNDFNKKPADNTEPKKKKNVFIKISDNISNRPKCYLILIIILILIILIIFIYYKGMLFIGPYCPNNIKSKAYKNRMANSSDSEPSNSKNKESKSYDMISSLKM